jgi:hypothetical protein
MTAALARHFECHVVGDELPELPPDRLSVVIGGAADDRECSLLCTDAVSSGCDQQLKQIGWSVEEDRLPDAVLMTQRQRADRLCWLLEMPELDCRVAWVTLQDDHAAES